MTNQLLFLHGAARHFLLENPNFSRYITSHLCDVAYENEIDIEKVQKTICGTCYSTFIPGLNTDVRLSKSKKKDINKIIYTCKYCARETHFPGITIEQRQSEETELKRNPVETQPITNNTNNQKVDKKKDKKKKTKADLKSLLAKSQKQSAGSSLSDFLSGL
jgi:RNase P subunit RPR2